MPFVPAQRLVLRSNNNNNPPGRHPFHDPAAVAEACVMSCLKSFPRLLLILFALPVAIWGRPASAARLLLPALAPASGYSRLLVTLRDAPAAGNYAGLPTAPAPITGMHMAYEAALGNNRYILKLFTNVPLPRAQTIARALLHDPSVLSASVINEHDKVFYGGVSTTSATEAPGTPSFEFYVPRKGGRNAPLVLALTAPGGMDNLVYFLAGYAEQYGAVVAVMALPADESSQAASAGSTDTRTLAQKITANDNAIAAVVNYAGKLTGARTGKFNLYGAGVGALVAERYVFQHPQQILQAVFDVATPSGATVPLAWPDGSQPYPAGISSMTLPAANPALFLKVPMQVLLPGSLPATDPDSGWATAMQQLAMTDSVANTQISSRAVRTDCPTTVTSNSTTYCMRNGWYAEAVFEGLFNAPPAGALPIFLTMGPDTQVAVGHSITINGIGAGNGWALFTPNSWSEAGGGALPQGTQTAPTSNNGTSMTFTPHAAGTYTFRLQASDVSKNQARAFINVTAFAPARSPLPAAGSPHADTKTIAIAGPSLVAPGEAFNLKAVLPAGVSINSVGCHWHQVTGAAATIVNYPKCQINYIAPSTPGLANFQLKVTNEQNAVIGSATHLIQVTPKATVPNPPVAQQPGKQKGKTPSPAPGKSPGSQAGTPGSLPSLSIPGLPPGLQKGLLPGGLPDCRPFTGRSHRGLPTRLQPPLARRRLPNRLAIASAPYLRQTRKGKAGGTRGTRTKVCAQDGPCYAVSRPLRAGMFGLRRAAGQIGAACS